MTTRKAIALTLLAVAAVALSACNTVEGVGRDVSAAGDGLSNAADETGKAISGEK